jgi:hypothetical protein
MSIFKSVARKVSLGSFVALFACCLCGCETLNQRVIDHDFPGLQASMDQPITCLLFVHGMGGYSNNDPAYIIDAISKLPHMQQTAASHDVQFAEGDTAGSLTRQDFVNTADGHELRIYTLYWEAVTKPIKTYFLGYDQQADYVNLRVPLDNDIRAGYMNDGVVDVILYVGQYKSAIQRTVKQALRKIHKDLETGDAQQKDYQFVFVTWSLGSKIVFDCLAGSHITADEAATPSAQSTEDELTFHKIARKTRAVFMLANQVPLLTLGDIESPPRTNQASTTMPYVNLRAVARIRKEAATPTTGATTQPQTPPLSIVAFSDPNDLFSYPIPCWLEETHDAEFANVSISVARTAIFIPIPNVGWIMNPVKAHTGYGIDPRVVDLILHGGKATTGYSSCP